MKIVFICSLFLYLYFVIYKSKKYMHMLQQNWYNDGNRYLKWIMDNFNKVFVGAEILFLLFYFLKGYTLIIVFICLYYLLYLMFNNKVSKEQKKKPLVITHRIRRLYFTMLVLYLVVIVLVIVNFDKWPLNYCFLALGLMSYLNPIIIWLSNIINKPVEKLVFEHYKHMAKTKLKQMKNLKRIGITGSYGKTSTKNFLNDILNVKYNSFATAKSFNTMNGLMISINNHLDKFSDVFVAEMGAFRRGEIKEKCNFIKPQYGILTTIGTAHLESFGSINNTQKAKFELIDSLPSDGIAVLNMDDEYQTSYNIKSKCKVVWVSTKNEKADVYAHNIKLSNKGTSFTCKFKDSGEEVKFETKLLGDANVYNVLQSIAMAYSLGMSTTEISIGVRRIETVEHRLELKEYSENITIIDDAYNSNPVGSKMALDVLSMMEGKKIIITPGMIEMGEEQDELNREFGRHIAEVCDEVILVGLEQTKPIYEGIKEKKYSENKIHILNDVKKAFPLMQQLSEGQTYVLIENDLPDIFNE